MKKILVFLITVAMILCLASGVMAATVSLQTGISGKAATGPMQWDTTNVFLLEFKAPLNNWLVDLDYSTLAVKDGSDSQIWNYDVKGGYSFINNNSARISATVGYYHQNIQSDILVGAVTLGLDSDFKLAENLNLEVEIDTALAGKSYQFYGVSGNLNSALHYKAKLNYYLSRNFGISLGYYYNEYKPEGADQTSHNALTLGVTGKF